MQHYQIRMKCGLCERGIVIDVISYGTPHQTIQSAACIQCAEERGIPLLKEGEVKELKFEKSPPATPAQMEGAIAHFRKAQDEGSGD